LSIGVFVDCEGGYRRRKKEEKEQAEDGARYVSRLLG
jgi:hypothetical protein